MSVPARRWRHRCRLALVLTVAAGAWSGALAQDRVTVVMRSSDSATGVLEDLANGTIYVRENLHSQRKLPIASILVMDFAGSGQTLPEAELNDARGDDHLLVLRNGARVRGRLLNIEGGQGSSKPDEPRIISFRTVDGEERRVRPAEVARLYLGRYPQKPAPLPETKPQATTTVPADTLPSGGIGVAANRQWTRVGLYVTQGQMLSFNASGRIVLSADDNDTATPAGSTTGRLAPRAPLPNVLAGALVGRVGDGPPFGIGNQTAPLAMPGTGELYLGVNDGDVADNRGEFRVQVTPTGTPSRRRR